jgi:hypothetical protein
MYPDLEFYIEYAEGGCDFSGKFTFKNGEVIERWEGNYHDLRNECNGCGEEVENRDGNKNYCYFCDSPVCAYCYYPVEENETDCPHCGCGFETTLPEEEQKE